MIRFLFILLFLESGRLGGSSSHSRRMAHAVVVDTSAQFGHHLLVGNQHHQQHHVANDDENVFVLNYTNFNHGSFGACPRSVLNYQMALRLQQEQQPDVWMRHRYKELVNETRRALADYLCCSSVGDDDGDDDDDRHYEVESSIVLTESASTAVNAILRSMVWQPGDVILYFSVAYGMVKNIVAYLVATEHVEAVEVVVQLPIADEVGDEAFIGPFQVALDTLRQKGQLTRLRLVVLEHIVSNPAMREPITVLAALTKSYQPNAFVLVDGAHALGQIPNLSIARHLSNIDAYLSNGHKWLYSPKGSAFMWVNQSAITDLFPQPTVISSENAIGSTSVSLAGRFEYVSTRDYTATIAMNAALQFRQQVLGGDDAIYHYVHGLAMDAKHYLQSLWNVSAIVPDAMEDFMFQLTLPSAIATAAQGVALQSWLLAEHHMYLIVIYDRRWDLLYTRISAQVYLEWSDFVRLGYLVLEFVATIAATAVSTAVVVDAAVVAAGNHEGAGSVSS